MFSFSGTRVAVAGITSGRISVRGALPSSKARGRLVAVAPAEVVVVVLVLVVVEVLLVARLVALVLVLVVLSCFWVLRMLPLKWIEFGSYSIPPSMTSYRY